MVNGKVRVLPERILFPSDIPRSIPNSLLKLNGILWVLTTTIGLAHQRRRLHETMIIELRRQSVESRRSERSSIRREKDILDEDADLECDMRSMSSLCPKYPQATLWKENISSRHPDIWFREVPPTYVPLRSVPAAPSASLRE